ncbi:hypothetical protein Hanom_Chr09g00783421 [Helianthus anomalus]
MPFSGIYEELFCFKVFHGGKFTDFPNRVYEGGKSDYVDLLNKDHFSLIDMHDIAQKLGYKNGLILNYHYLLPYHYLDYCLRPLCKFDDVKSLLNHTPVHSEFNAYIEEGEIIVGIGMNKPMKRTGPKKPVARSTLNVGQVEIIDAVSEKYFDAVMNLVDVESCVDDNGHSNKVETAEPKPKHKMRISKVKMWLKKQSKVNQNSSFLM